MSEIESQNNVSEEVKENAENNDTKPKSKWKFFLKLLGIGLLCYVTVGLVWNQVDPEWWKNFVNSSKSSSSTSTASGPQEYFEKNSGVAQRMCKDSIKNKLKSPSSANFSNLSAIYVGKLDNGDVRGVVSGSVEASNSFGAKIKQHIVCRFNWDGKTFNLVESEIQ